jgi:hypothetical protein
VPSGGVFTWDPTYAIDDFTAPCAAGPGADVFFEITLSTPEARPNSSTVRSTTCGSTGVC